MKEAAGLLAFYAALAFAAPAQTFTTLDSFDGADGAQPWGALVQATNGYLYGTTYAGGAGGTACGRPGCGTVFEVSPSGTLTTLHSFDGADGKFPYAALVQASNGDLHGSTSAGGAHGYGTIFAITLSGTLTTLYNFCSETGCPDGSGTRAALIQATNGDLYGTTESGGANDGGTVFKITPRGTLTTLYNFCSLSGCADGSGPLAGLVQAVNGLLYGTTIGGGANGNFGTVFEITPGGALTTLYSFCSLSGCEDGQNPNTTLVQAAAPPHDPPYDGNFFGTTYSGGTDGVGTLFEITPTGALSTLYSFPAQGAPGPYPNALIEGSDWNFYGTTQTGGTLSTGAIFELHPVGFPATLYSFCPSGCSTSGQQPQSGLMQDTNGVFYGTGSYGGAENDGVIFSFSVPGLGPFVATQPTAGAVGTAVRILGTGLTGATSVTFNGTAAVFTVVSSSEITTSVPAGATSGKVEVATPSGTLSSSGFKVP